MSEASVRARGSKRLLFATYTFLPDIGGVATATHNLCSEMAKAGYDVKVVTLTRNAKTDLGYEVVRNPGPLKLINMFRKSDVILFNNTSLRLGWPAVLFPFKAYGLFHHSEALAEIIAFGNAPKRFFSRIIAKRSSHFFASRYLKSVLSSVTSSRLGQAIVYPVARSEPLDQQLDRYVQREGAVFAGRLVSEKGAAFLIQNWPLIRDSLAIRTLRIIGSGPEQQMLAEAAAIYPEITFLGSMLPDAVAVEMRKAAFVLVPSIWAEPFGIVAVEGVAAGAVVVSSDRGGLPEAVGSMGVTFNMDDPNDFARALERARELREQVVSSSQSFGSFLERRERHLDRFSERNALGALSTIID